MEEMAVKTKKNDAKIQLAPVDKIARDQRRKSPPN